MELFKIRKDIPFMRHALVLNAVSFITFILAVFFLFSRGLHLSVEFTGGTVMEVSYSQPADLPKVRGVIYGLGYAEVQVQNFGSAREVLIRLPVQKGVTTAQQSETVLNAVSFITFALAVFFLFSRGLHLSVEFTGGTLMEVSYSQPANLQKVRGTVASLGYGEVFVQNFGSAREVLIRLPAQKGVSSAQQSEKVLSALKADDPDVTLRRTEFVGPQVGDELVEDGLMALAFVVGGIMLYLAIRFEWKFAVSAIVANLHDVIIILGFFAFFQWEFSLAVLAAVLAVLGYSVNESVVIFDRIRENFRRYRKMNTVEIIDNAITSTISRTIITHGSTQIMVLSMLLFGGETLFYFALALTIGICFGIYSSVFVGAAVAMWLGISREDMVKPVKKDIDPNDENSGAVV